MRDTAVISIRVPQEIKREIEALGVKATVFVKEAIEEALKRKKSEEALRRIRENIVPGKEIGFDSVKIIRQTREAQ